MEKLYCVTSTKGETYFYISILETGWIYDVFLILTDKIRSKYEENQFERIKLQYEGKNTINENIYSVFSAYYEFKCPSDFMVAFFIYTIEGTSYVTKPMYFAVEDSL